MKLLVVSLLRLGDIIQQEPLLRGLREKNPEAEIHLLINRQFAGVADLLEGVVDKFYYFDRESLQKGLGEAAYNILWSYSRLEALVQELNDQSYDQVLNFTHNKLSAYLVGAIKSTDKRGLYQADGKFQGLDNRWLRYFNDRFSGTKNSLFHYAKILGKSFDIPVKPAATVSKKSKLVLFQCLTSDVKKNWGLINFRDLKETIEASLVDYEVCILGAPFERESLAQVFGESDLLICDLVEAREHLKKAALLVTGDTSIKHLAAQMGVPTIEIAIGSSDWTKTAAFSEGASLIAADVACAPCGHSQACSQKSHLCSEQVSVEKVFTAVWNQLSQNHQPRTVGIRDFERAVWELYLDKGHRDIGLFYASSALEFINKFGKSKVMDIYPQWIAQSQVYAGWMERLRRALPARETLQKKSSLQSSDVAELVLCAQDILKSNQDGAGYFQAVVEALTTRFSAPVQVFDRMQAAMAEVNDLLDVRNNFTRYLEIVSKEGAYYANGIGQLPISGFEEAGRSVQRSHEDADL